MLVQCCLQCFISGVGHNYRSTCQWCLSVTQVRLTFKLSPGQFQREQLCKPVGLSCWHTQSRSDPEAVTHPTTNTVKCCLTSEFLCDQVYPSLYGPRQLPIAILSGMFTACCMQVTSERVCKFNLSRFRSLQTNIIQIWFALFKLFEHI